MTAQFDSFSEQLTHFVANADSAEEWFHNSSDVNITFDSSNISLKSISITADYSRRGSCDVEINEFELSPLDASDLEIEVSGYYRVVHGDDLHELVKDFNDTLKAYRERPLSDILSEAVDRALELQHQHSQLERAIAERDLAIAQLMDNNSRLRADQNALLAQITPGYNGSPEQPQI